MKRTLVYFLMVLLAVARFSAAAPDHVDLIILHVNDQHGHINPFPDEFGRGTGGIARLATVVKGIRAANPGRVLLLNAGDVFSRGDPVTTYYAGEVDLRLMDKIGFDALTPGNGDFYFGMENLRKLKSMVKFPFTYANVMIRKTGEKPFVPFVVDSVAGIRVGIVGLGTISEDSPSAGEMRRDDPATVADTLVPDVRRESDLVVALTHIGEEADLRLAAEVPGIDVIVGGHSHTFLDKPVTVTRRAGDGEVIIVQAGENLECVGRLELGLEKKDGTWTVVSHTDTLVPLNYRVGEDPGIRSTLDKYNIDLKRQICMSTRRFANPDTGRSPMGDLVAEAMRKQSRADIALLDRGAVLDTLGTGPVTLADVCRIHPWRNKVLLMDLRGSEIRDVLRRSGVLTAGCTFTRSQGAIDSLMVGVGPVDPMRTYQAAVGEFLAWNTPALRAKWAKDSGLRVDSALEAYLKSVAVVR
jgi:2',3'-cyclic-nucleotide 2'-phosphodiesterase (5'-nucleotidase family)